MERFLKNKRLFNKKVLMVLGMLICIVSASVFFILQKTVVIAHDGVEVEVKTIVGNVEELLNKKGIEIGEKDKVLPGLEERIEDGTRIEIHRAVSVYLVDKGIGTKVFTIERNIRNLLRSLDITLGEDDRVEPSIARSIGEGQKIEITRVERERIIEEEEIPFQTLIRYNNDLEQGKINIVQEGEMGIKEISIEVVYENGVEISREEIEEGVKKEPINEIVEKGTAKYLITSRGETRRYKKVITMTATAYDAGYESTGKRPGDPYYGITSSGTQVRPGVVAVDPRVIPMGTRLYVESLDKTKSYGFAVAEDIGGAIKGNKIDLYFEDRSDVMRFGRRKVKVYILD